jgi:hypothetical protein
MYKVIETIFVVICNVATSDISCVFYVFNNYVRHLLFSEKINLRFLLLQTLVY